MVSILNNNNNNHSNQYSSRLNPLDQPDGLARRSGNAKPDTHKAIPDSGIEETDQSQALPEEESSHGNTNLDKDTSKFGLINGNDTVNSDLTDANSDPGYPNPDLNNNSSPRLSLTTTSRPRYQNSNQNILFQQQPHNNLLDDSKQLLFNETTFNTSDLFNEETFEEDENSSSEHTTSPSYVIRRTRILNKNTWKRLGWKNIVLLIIFCILVYFLINICSICIAWCILAVKEEDEDEKERRKKKELMKADLGSTAGSNRSRLYRVEAEEMQESERAQQFQEEELTIRVEDMKASLILPSVSSRSGSNSSRLTSTVNLDSSSDSLFQLGTVELHNTSASEESSAVTADSRMRSNVVSNNPQILTVLPVSATLSEVKQRRVGCQSQNSQMSLKTSYHSLGDDLGTADRVDSSGRTMPSVIDNYNEEFPRQNEQLVNADPQLWSIEEV